MTRFRLVLAVGIVATAMVALFFLQRWRSGASQEPLYRDSFRIEKQDDWQPFGGAWEIADGVMRNNSDERGAKTMNGSVRLKNYMVEADVQLLGQYGDAGLIIRASNEEEGVDAYDGYYAGIRNLDNTLILGRAGYGWIEYQARHVLPRVYAQEWYHIKLLAFGCNIAASATSPSGQTTTDAIQDPNCVQSGRFGLKSFQSGGLWRNVQVHAATYQDLASLTGGAKIPLGDPDTVVGPTGKPRGESEPVRTASDTEEQYLEPLYLDMREHHVDPQGQPIANLRALAPDKPTPVTVHGVVTLTFPTLFVQDSTGGVAIHNFRAKTPPQIGDQVEARGDAELHDFSSVIKNADVHILWSHAPIHSMSVTASQAATGSFDAQYIELEGHLESKEEGPDHTMVLNLAEDNQSFRAIANGTSGPFLRLKDKSRLRLRGICVVDSKYTHDLTPFAILLPSLSDVEVLEGPPWWSTGHIVVAIIAFLLLILAVQTLHNYIDRWRLIAVLEERERLAHEMHDTLAQSFAGIGFQLQAIRDEIDDRSAIDRELDLASSLVRRSHEEAKRSIAALRPELLESVGLLKALEQSAQSMVAGGVIQVTALVSGEAHSIPVRISDTLFRIGQEALANAVRHGNPSSLLISLTYSDAGLHLTIEDDGRGFVVDADSVGFGIRGMRKRADIISAELEIRSLPGGGTSVQVVAPMPAVMMRRIWPTSIWHFLWERRFHGQATNKANPPAYR
ncbi:MAG TPA: sensor histidine kinase [Terriglobales bacterium]|nr:sensor histidine kinase [Terriglobales bacterium]